MKDFIVSPSVLNADLNHFDQEIAKIKKAGMRWIHFDAMDGKFVKNINFEKPLLQKLCQNLDLVKDVHIMINNPLEHVIDYKECGADYLTFHYEACQDDEEVNKVIDKIHSLNMKAGISIKPKTPVEVIYPFLKKLDLVLVMSVEPGYGGQKFIANSLDKIASLRAEIDSLSLSTLISVDGGINDLDAADCLNAGANILVVGQYLFGHEDFCERYQRLVK